MSKLEQLRAQYRALVSKVTRMADIEVLTDEQDLEFRQAINVAREVGEELARLERRAAQVDHINASKYKEYSGMPQNPSYTTNDYTDAALRALERGTNRMSARAADNQERLIRNDSVWARQFEVCARPEYDSAFGKYLRYGGGEAALYFDDAERQAVLDMASARAQAEGTTTQGGFALPVFIDPSVILTNQESDNPFLRICRTVDVQSNQWKGVSAAGVVWSFDAEAAEVSDDSITLAQPSVSVFMARGFIPYSIEVGEDWPGFQSEMARLLAIGYDELLLSKFSTGSGTGEPRGILTALDANTNVEVVSTTDGAFGHEDIYKVWGALPQKARRRASWMMSVDVMNKIRQFGAANVYHAATVTLPEAAVDVLFSKPVYENPYFPDMTGTSGHENRLVVGNFDSFVIARRSGLVAEVVPHLLATANNLPSGQRGLFCHARIGGNVVEDVGSFRLLQNT
jgi:HK97 family phage major capsid protein